MVMQVLVGSALYDALFNGRTGYRAHFRAAPVLGLAFNDDLIRAVRVHLDRRLPDQMMGRQLNAVCEDLGPARISKAFMLASLLPTLSKVWRCDKLIGKHGGITDLAIGVVGPGIRLDSDKRWAAFHRDQSEAWLDFKGAFIGDAAGYQI